MSLNTDVETAILDLIDPAVMGRAMTINGATVNAILSPDESLGNLSYPGQITERYKLICARTALTAIVGNEITIDSVVWTVVGSTPLELLTRLTIERYTA